MEINKINNIEYNFPDLDEELNDYEGEPGKISGINFDTLDYKESKKENSTEAEKKSGRVTKKRRVLPKIDSEKLDVIFQSENICKEKRLKHYLDVWREEAKNKQSETDDYLSGKTLADDEESVFWQTPSQSASQGKRNKRFSSFEDKLKEGSAGQYREEESDDDELTLVNQSHDEFFELFDAAIPGRNL
ncbi:15943_t:CDS:2 [Funneliformis caledonium]|uniref:15943_t:CDS:1 n=1 Tax=Funneliformis caledonium TaxID=1117310 RepID=A0A9N9CLF4_9GLOM|nr:15943_t:CDS:2 [Funneliformis caledonium]